MQTILLNGKIYQQRGRFAQAMLIENGVIALCGSNQQVRSRAGAGAAVIDLGGRTVVPGFNDSHLHLYNVGCNLQSVQLYGCRSAAEVVERCRAFIKAHQVPAGVAVSGRGWNQDYFAEGAHLLTRRELDQISTEHPILLKRACGHVVSCNSRALELAGITRETPQPAGARFDLDENGEPTGVFREQATQLVERILPPPTQADVEQTLRVAMAHAAENGITSVQTNDVNAERDFEMMLAAYRRLASQGEATLRAYHQCCFMDVESYRAFADRGYTTGVGDDFSRIGPLKLFLDGSLGARTARMRRPYADEPGQLGISCLGEGQLDALMAAAVENRQQVAVHAIGDGAVQQAISCFEKYIPAQGNLLRHGIVHCQITDATQLARIRARDILVYAQPIFLHYDLHIVHDRVGRQLAESSYNFGTMVRMGIHTSYGTDSPVEDLNTMDNLFCAVNRQDLEGFPDGGFGPDQAVDIYTAVDAYTIGSAYCSFDETRKGRLLPGYLADLAVLDQDIFTLPPSQLRGVRVMATMVGGRMVYER